MTERQRRPRHSKTLQRFLDGYLHQDFRLEYESPAAAAAAFASDSSPAEQEWARQALQRFATWAAQVEEEAWRAAWKAQGGAWRPSGPASIRAVADALEAWR
ncbi:MAG: contact-dependent growth inhibition system immunity protein [Dehalococcoidia bacterium]